MTIKDYIAPMINRNIYFVVYPGFELLDLSGPMSVFSTANAVSNTQFYLIKTLSAGGGLVTSSAGLTVQTESLDTIQCDSVTTMLVVGAEGPCLEQASEDISLRKWLQEQTPLSERFGSICTGTFVLQSAGVLDDFTVTTHWAGCETLKLLKSKESVLRDALYHTDGKCWTSAGVTTGIDMALEMVKRDQGMSVMQSVAKYLVVYAQRPGKQSQFSTMQNIRLNEEDVFAELIAWLRKEITRPVKVNEMADFMCMSERSFQRKFSASFSDSPSRFFERMRMEYARDFLLPKQSVQLTAKTLGYSSVAAFRTSFEKHFGLSPSTCKQIF